MLLIYELIFSFFNMLVLMFCDCVKGQFHQHRFMNSISTVWRFPCCKLSKVGKVPSPPGTAYEYPCVVTILILCFAWPKVTESSTPQFITCDTCNMPNFVIEILL